MADFLLFIDDSGTKEYARPGLQYGVRGNSKYFVLGSVLIGNQANSLLLGSIRTLKADVFGTEDVEIKSHWLRNAQKRREKYLDPFGLSDGQLQDFVLKFYEIVVETDLQLIAAVVDKEHMQQRYKYPHHPLVVAYDLLLQRVVQAIGTLDRVSVTMDDMTGRNPRGTKHKTAMSGAHDQFKKTGSLYRPGLNPACIQGRLKFLNSAMSHQIQVADLVSYNVQRQFRDHGDAWEDRSRIVQGGRTKLPAYEYFMQLAGKFRKGPNGRIQGFGVVKMPLINRIPWKV